MQHTGREIFVFLRFVQFDKCTKCMLTGSIHSTRHVNSVSPESTFSPSSAGCDVYCQVRVSSTSRICKHTTCCYIWSLIQFDKEAVIDWLQRKPCKLINDIKDKSLHRFPADHVIMVLSALKLTLFRYSGPVCVSSQMLISQSAKPTRTRTDSAV